MRPYGLGGKVNIIYTPEEKDFIHGMLGKSYSKDNPKETFKFWLFGVEFCNDYKSDALTINLNSKGIVETRLIKRASSLIEHSVLYYPKDLPVMPYEIQQLVLEQLEVCKIVPNIEIYNCE